MGKKRKRFYPPYRVDIWSERDRLSIVVYDSADNVVAEWWDDDAIEMFELGFFDERNTEQSVIDYLVKTGVIEPEENPKKFVKIYDKICAIEAQKGDDSLWPGEYFRHDFKKDETHAEVLGLPDGSVLIRSKKGKRLWKKFNY